MTAAQYISAICPTLAADPSLAVFLDMAESQTGGSFFGSNRALAVALRAAHIFTVCRRSMGAAGSISSMEEGSLNLAFASSGETGDLSQTSYGLQLKNLMKSSGPGVSVMGLYE